MNPMDPMSQVPTRSTNATTATIQSTTAVDADECNSNTETNMPITEQHRIDINERCNGHGSLALAGSDTHENTSLLLSVADQDDEHSADRIRNANPTSLAWAPTTPRITAWLIPFVALLTHGLFLYGQIEPMWKLTQSQAVDVWWNATGSTARWAFDTLGLPQDLNFERYDQSTIQTFTYSFAIQELWEAKGMSGPIWLPRMAAVLLALFSGAWPHLKLILLTLTWILKLPLPPSRYRTTTLHWLSCLGKWSLADILVVCVMVGVLHMDWFVDPDEIRRGVADHLPELLHLVQTQYHNATALCTVLLTDDCNHPDSVSHHIQCDACMAAVKTAFWQPDWAESTGRSILNGITTSGSGICELRVVGMRGIYSFCAAVILSICLSLLVDVFDQRYNQYCDDEFDSGPRDDEQQQLINSTLQNMESRSSRGDFVQEEEPLTNYMAMIEEADSDEAEPLLAGTVVHSSLNLQSGSDDDGGNGDTASCPTSLLRLITCCCHCGRLVITMLVLIASICAASWITLERSIHGAIPTLLHSILGVEWNKSYSLYTLSAMTGAAGGWDILLMATFSLFIVVGPVFRSFMCFLRQLLAAKCGRLRKIIQTLVNFIGAFCAWEVLIVAITMICLLMPSITSTILMDPRCSEIVDTPAGPGNCFEVEFRVRRTFGLVLISGILLVLVSNSSWFVGSTERTRPRTDEPSQHYGRR
jgi:hypothetical protein